MSEQDRGAIVDAGQYLLIRLARDKMPGARRTFEEPVFAVAV